MRLKVIALVASLAAGLAAAELAARALHRGAYPYLNLFEPDARYGVRLAPNASTRVRSRDGRITDIATNALGFRGPDWPRGSPAGRRVLLLGDSQVLGYGVAFEDTMGEQLRRLGGAEVLAAAVPSWGPHESVLALQELAPVFQPTDVVFVANAANDWFETLPNVRRTSARDGWAALPGDAPARAFPLRGWLLGRSHLVLAARQLLHFVGPAESPVAVTPQRLAREAARLGSLKPVLSRALEACRLPSCRMSAAALPLDVQVSAAEWKKYRGAAVELSGTEELLEGFVADARSLGVPAVNLLEPLRAAEPGAFLPDDYHLSPHGHRAVARALQGLHAEARR